MGEVVDGLPPRPAVEQPAMPPWSALFPQECCKKKDQQKFLPDSGRGIFKPDTMELRLYAACRDMVA